MYVFFIFLLYVKYIRYTKIYMILQRTILSIILHNFYYKLHTDFYALPLTNSNYNSEATSRIFIWYGCFFRELSVMNKWQYGRCHFNNKMIFNTFLIAMLICNFCIISLLESFRAMKHNSKWNYNECNTYSLSISHTTCWLRVKFASC